MDFYFDTINGFGHITHEDFIYNPVVFVPSPSEYEFCLEKGLLPDEANGEGKEWFASRSTRINVANFVPNKTAKRLSSKVDIIKHEFIYESSWSRITRLFKEYCDYKKFDNPYDIELLCRNNLKQKNILLYYYDLKLIGCTIFRVIGSNMVSLQFITDYSHPELSLGKVAQIAEIDFCKANNLKYCYLMPAYESSCLYKADFHGLEWFDGKVWKTDMVQLKQLMLNDEKVKIIDERI